MNWQQCPRPRSMSTPYPHFCPPVDDPADFSFKVLVIGDTNVGKTSFINMFCENVFRVNGTGTIGMDLKKKIIDVDGKKIRLHVWDTAGQERYRTLTTAYYRGATGIIILYDITRETSFNHVTNWLEDIALNVSSDICKVLVGNKSDFPKKDKRLSERATTLAESFDFPYIEASAKTGENVEKVFENLTRQMLDSYDKKMNTNRPLSPRPSAAEKIELLAKKKSTFSAVCSC